jgi:hypothetical protein
MVLLDAFYISTNISRSAPLSNQETHLCPVDQCIHGIQGSGHKP